MALERQAKFFLEESKFKIQAHPCLHHSCLSLSLCLHRGVWRREKNHVNIVFDLNSNDRFAALRNCLTYSKHTKYFLHFIIVMSYDSTLKYMFTVLRWWGRALLWDQGCFLWNKQKGWCITCLNGWRHHHVSAELVQRKRRLSLLNGLGKNM